MAKAKIDLAAQLKAAVKNNGEHYKVDVPPVKKPTSIALTETELRLLAKAESFLTDRGFYSGVNKTAIMKTLIHAMKFDDAFVKAFEETTRK